MTRIPTKDITGPIEIIPNRRMSVGQYVTGYSEADKSQILPLTHSEQNLGNGIMARLRF